jgi:hypothetical protein
MGRESLGMIWLLCEYIPSGITVIIKLIEEVWSNLTITVMLDVERCDQMCMSIEAREDS